MIIKILIAGLLSMGPEALGSCCFKLLKKRSVTTQNPLFIDQNIIDERSIETDKTHDLRFRKLLDKAKRDGEGYIDKDNPYFQEILNSVPEEESRLAITVFKRDGIKYTHRNYVLAQIKYFRDKGMIRDERIYVIKDNKLLLNVWLITGSAIGSSVS